MAGFSFIRGTLKTSATPNKSLYELSMENGGLKPPVAKR